MEPEEPWVVITGATGGIGRAVASRCHRDGMRVLALGRHEQRLAALPLRTLAVDLRDRDADRRVLEALGEGPRVRGLVHVAGASLGAPIDAVSDADWDDSLEVNVTAPMRLARALLPALRRAEGASIVHVSSPVAIRGSRKVGYAASKAALLGLTLAMARNLGPDGIRVNAVLPGPTITGMTADWPADRRVRIAAESPLGRLCRPEDVAGAVAFLLGPDSAYVTGSTLDVTGGTLLGGG